MYSLPCIRRVRNYCTALEIRHQSEGSSADGARCILQRPSGKAVKQFLSHARRLSSRDLKFIGHNNQYRWINIWTSILGQALAGLPVFFCRFALLRKATGAIFIA
ncbi:DUF2684 family protein [Serratia inhibens]|uniref:DUF2684 family protein n=1 Tax=Serratia inhibens TaxID=2338073 RepID=A0AA92X0Q7_9GAMM|nr:DUF2684 family protein [Serratia inhibens]